MKTIKKISDALSSTPEILSDLLHQVPTELLKEKRIKNKWSIHEHACHICSGDKYVFHKRLLKFKNEATPVFNPVSGDSFDENFLNDMDLNTSLNEFVTLRKKTIEFINHFDKESWNKKGVHPEYKEYTPYILLRHMLMHDHLHMYRIEELWLTKKQFLPTPF